MRFIDNRFKPHGSAPPRHGPGGGGGGTAAAATWAAAAAHTGPGGGPGRQQRRAVPCWRPPLPPQRGDDPYRRRRRRRRAHGSRRRARRLQRRRRRVGLRRLHRRSLDLERAAPPQLALPEREREDGVRGEEETGAKPSVPLLFEQWEAHVLDLSPCMGRRARA
jgi:hypothetical protein